MAVRRSCYLCGSKYEFCDCNRQPRFMATFCSENCRDIFKSLSQYGCNLISAEDCKELLECCDLQPELYKESTRKNIEKILATKIEAEIIPEEIPEIIEEPDEEIELPEYKNEVVLESNE